VTFEKLRPVGDVTDIEIEVPALTEVGEMAIVCCWASAEVAMQDARNRASAAMVLWSIEAA
jgi:hypothetical protein